MGIPPGLKFRITDGFSPLTDDAQAEQPFPGKGAIGEGQAMKDRADHQCERYPVHHPCAAGQRERRIDVETKPVEGKGYREEYGGEEKVEHRTLFKHRMEFFYVSHVYISGVSCQGEFDWAVSS